MTRLLTAPATRPWRLGPASGRLSIRALLVSGLATTALAVVSVLALGAGDYPIAPDRIVATLLGGGDAQESLVVLRLRMPRIALGVLVGVMLGLSGAIVQTTARNGLASPDLLGVTAGAGAGAVAVIVLGGTGTGVASILHGIGTSAAALAGGLLAALVVGGFLRLIGGSGFLLVLVGVGVSATFGGLTSWMLVEASIDDAERASAWLAGSLNGRGTDEVGMALVALGIAVTLLIPLAPALSALHLGETTAATLGHRVGRVRALLLVSAVVLASIAAAVAGPIGFIALVAPHLARLSCRAPRAPLVASAVIGAVLVVTSDLVARTVAAPLLLPTGAVTALVGAPFLIWLLIRERKAIG